MDEETCFVQYLRERVRNADALHKDAIEHGDRKASWWAKGKLEEAEEILRVHIANGINW